ncbi:helix-turn-helix domain-containing protein [Streptomyces alkaliphilus]|uniref:helix-turn-helix domain-containing protein n=1 Tax=Streptomyces alkaliphilus TaxID=1472722 RepID=UPI0034D2367C
MHGGEATKDFNPAPTPLERFGHDVKRVRMGRRLTQRQLGKAAGYSESYVSQVESGKLLPSERFAEGCDLAFGTNGLFGRMLHRLQAGDHPSQFAPYVQLEQRATRLLDFSTTTVMGLLQTEDYAHAIFRAGHPEEAENVIAGKVAARVGRWEVLEHGRFPALWVVMHEACLRTRVGGASVMAAQLAHLMNRAELPRVDIQVIPYAAGAAAAHSGPFTLMAFENEPMVLYAGDPQGGNLYRDKTTVAAHLRHYDRLRAHALPPDESSAFIAHVSKEYIS